MEPNRRFKAVPASKGALHDIKKQSSMVAHSPIKIGSRRTHNIHTNVLGSLNSEKLRSNKSNETLVLTQGKKTPKNHNYSTSLKSPASVGSVIINDGKLSSRGGLTFKKVKHFIDRACMWY